MSDTLVTEASSDDRPKAHLRPRGTSFVGLVGVELRRLWWRRLTKAVLVAVVGLVGVAAYGIHEATDPEVIAQRVDEYKRVVQDLKRMEAETPPEVRAEQRAQCERDQAAERERSGNAGVDFNCDQPFPVPSPDDFGIRDTARDALTVEWSRQLLYFFGFLAFLLGGSFICAEFASGSMGNWLTFQTRRLRVGSAKLVAVTLGGLGIGAAGVALIGLFSTVITTINRPGEVTGLGAAVPAVQAVAGDPTVLSLLRIVAVVGLGALGGAVLGLLLRSTAGVMGVAVGYAVVFEGFVANVFGEGRLTPWLVYPNIEGFVRKGHEYYATVCGDKGCASAPHVVTFSHGYTYLLVLAVVGVALGLASFRSRDVT